MALVVIIKVYNNSPEVREFIDKTYVEECCKENIFVDKVFFLALIMIVMLLCISKV